MKYKLSSVFLLVAAASGNANAGECGSVTIADMNWNSATLIANIDQFILEHGYGCDAELIPGDTMPTGTSMIEKGQPDVAPELWSNSLKDALDKGVEEKRLRYAGKALVNGGEEGFWVPATSLNSTLKWQPSKAYARTLVYSNTLKTQIHLHSTAALQAGTVRSAQETCLMLLS